MLKVCDFLILLNAAGRRRIPRWDQILLGFKLTVLVEFVWVWLLLVHQKFYTKKPNNLNLDHRYTLLKSCLSHLLQTFLPYLHLFFVINLILSLFAISGHARPSFCGFFYFPHRMRNNLFRRLSLSGLRLARWKVLEPSAAEKSKEISNNFKAGERCSIDSKISDNWTLICICSIICTPAGPSHFWVFFWDSILYFCLGITSKHISLFKLSTKALFLLPNYVNSLSEDY